MWNLESGISIVKCGVIHQGLFNVELIKRKVELLSVR